MRIGVFGGSFDPVHRAHLAVAEQASRELALDAIRFIPAGLQPLKADGPRAPAADRAAMLEAAVSGHAGWTVDLREVRRPGPSYTVDTLRELAAEHPQDRLFLLVGADAARDLSRWRDSEEILRLATVAVVPRPGVAVPVLPRPAVTLTLKPVDLSATAVRGAAARGERIDHLVPPAVADYIAAHQLYRTGAAC